MESSHGLTGIARSVPGWRPRSNEEAILATGMAVALCKPREESENRIAFLSNQVRVIVGRVDENGMQGKINSIRK